VVNNYRIQYAYCVDRQSQEFRAPWNQIDTMAWGFTPDDKAMQTAKGQPLSGGACFIINLGGQGPMELRKKLTHELKSVGLLTLYFGCWLAAFLLLKQLILAEYHIEFSGMSKAVVGALILSKVVLVMQHVPLGTWVRRQSAWVDVVLRTTLYALGVLAVLLLEKGFEGRHEYGGFIPSLSALFQNLDMPNVWANVICLSGALLVYNILSVIRMRLGVCVLVRMFLTPLPEEPAGNGD
tara:strand:+ start:14474 stop:15187 length:714 start_codon:yes stop_codon:yes gene_type:complete